MRFLEMAVSKIGLLAVCLSLTGAVGCENETGGGGGGAALGGGARGTCCAGGDCLCHGNLPALWNNLRGPFAVRRYGVGNGQVFYPTNAQPPFAGVSLCGGFLNTGWEMTSWGNYYASYGIVTHITNTGMLDLPDARGRKLLRAVATLKQENNRIGSPLQGKMSNRYGTSGYSMGGGGTTLASRSDRTLKASVALAAWAPTGLGVSVPTLFLCGGVDLIAGCGGARGSLPLINAPKMIVTAPLAGHLAWFGPGDTGLGKYGLAWLKTYLEGDTRWKQFLQQGIVTARNL